LTPLRPLFDVYSLALLTAMLLTGAAFVVIVWRSWTGRHHLLAVAGRLSLIALAFSVFALSFHLGVGHPAGSAAELSPLAFVGAHRAMSIVVLVAAVLAATTRPRQAP